MKILPVREKYNISSSLISVRNADVSMTGTHVTFNKYGSKIRNSKFFQTIKENLINYSRRLNYTWQHKKAFLKVEKKLCGKNSLGGYFHDVDKLLLYIIGIPQKTAHNIHVNCAPHHFRNGHIKKPLMAIIDWECARYTKPDKQLSAREFYEKVYVKERNIRIPEIEELLDKFGL